MSGLVLVTGAGGAIGRNIVRILAGRGARVLGLGHGMPDDGAPVIDWISGEIDAENLGALVERWGRPDAIIHLAGSAAVGPSLAAPDKDFQRTPATTVRLLEWVRQNAIEASVVLVSSAAVYGDQHAGRIPETAARTPLSPYGYHKAMMEMAGECWARNFGLKIAIVRSFSVYGTGLRKQLIWEICSRLLNGTRALVLGGTGAETRDWVHIDDTSRMIIDATGLASVAAPVFNVCTGRAISVADTIGLIVKGFDVPVTIEFNGISRPGDPMHLVGDADRASKAGLVATILAEDGLVNMARELRDQRAP